MLAAAARNGFIREGVLRSSAWVMGEFLDEIVLGLLVDEWKPARSPKTPPPGAEPGARVRRASSGG